MHFLPQSPLTKEILRNIGARSSTATENLRWLQERMDPYFFVTMSDEAGALASLALELPSLAQNRRVLLCDQEQRLIVARQNQPGSLYETLTTLSEQKISYAEFVHSSAPLPGSEHELEIQRFEFDRKGGPEVTGAARSPLPARIRSEVAAALAEHYPGFNGCDLDRLLRLFWINNERYLRISPPRRVAQILWLYQQATSRGGIYLDVEPADAAAGGETRILFAVGNPPQRDFLIQVMEVLNRLHLGVRRGYCLTINNGNHPYFLGTFYVRMRHGGVLTRGSREFEELRQELYNTQILSTSSHAYREFVTNRVMTGEEASLVNALISFCHTNLAHHHPDPFDYEDVMRAFHSHLDITLQLTSLFRLRFDPEVAGRGERYREALARTERLIEEYNTGHRYIDEIRRAIFRCSLLFVRHTLKTNFFVPEKHALSFRLDPAYLAELDRSYTADLPPETPFRVTFFFGRYGAGYHIGFSDIARGGWRTVLTNGRDDYVSTAASLFREVFVLAHTQHLKNKDIYEGGSKMVVLLDAADLEDREVVTQRLYKLQYGFLNAFLDIFVTTDGRARDPRVVDYYAQDEPIELGPDENMHDAMIEQIAAESLRRGYLLGIGIISSKRVGINHKEYGVTSTGVVSFASTAMAELGIDIQRDPFSVKFTGGPSGDVAGNAMRILLERCPRVKIALILDGSAALWDPRGADRTELERLVLQSDLEEFDPARLNPGGLLLYRGRRRKEGLRELFLKVVATEEGLREEWVSLDEFNREYNDLVFTTPADLFIPAGGRPETINSANAERYFLPDGSPSARVIVEGANSFLTPDARAMLQKRGVVIMRDASANKCGVISSSYEIIANLLLSEKEFLAHKDAYVRDVLEILERRAGDEARLIFRRHRESCGTLMYTEISDAISREINAHYSRLFNFFQANPKLCREPLFRRTMLSHLPRLVRESRRFRQRVAALPAKYQFAILASEIASSIVYRGGWDANFEETLRGYLQSDLFAPPPAATGGARQVGR